MNTSTPPVQQVFSAILPGRFPRDERPAADVCRGVDVGSERRSAGRRVPVAASQGFANAGPDCYWEVSTSR